jgi:integrase/recombinase XerD
MAPMRRRQRLLTVLSIAEVDRLLIKAHALADDPSSGLFKQASYARRAALLETIYASGMRVSEAASLRARTACAKVSHLLIRGKGDKERIVPLHAKALDAILRWRRLAAEYGTHSGIWLFHSVRDGKKHLTTRAAELEIKDTAVAAGLSRADLVTPHGLRYALARKRSRPAPHSIVPGACRLRNHRDIHACRNFAIQGHGDGPAPLKEPPGANRAASRRWGLPLCTPITITD